MGRAMGMGMRMRTGVRTKAGVAAVLSAALLAGCDDDPTGLTPEALAGDWIAVQATVTNLADPSESQDLMAAGLDFTLTLGADGSVRISLTLGTLVDVDDGTYTIDGNRLSMVLDGDPVSGTISGGGDVIDVVVDQGVEWDFEDNGIEVPARLALVLERD